MTLPASPAPSPPPTSPEAADLRTARVMDNILTAAAAAGVGAAGVRALFGFRDMLAQPGRVRGWPPSRKAVVPLPYVAPPGRARKKEARRRGPIDAAANMRALNAGPAFKPSPGAPAAENPAIAANLAKTRANRAQPGYASSFVRTNTEPYGRPATGTPAAAPPPSLSPHAPADAIAGRHAAGLHGVIAAQAAARPAPAAQAAARPAPAAAAADSRWSGPPTTATPSWFQPGALRAAGAPSPSARSTYFPFSSPTLAAIGAPGPSAPPAAAPPQAPGGLTQSPARRALVQPPTAARPLTLSGLAQPPTGGIAPVGSDFAAPGLKAASGGTPPEPSGLAKALSRFAGLAREGAAPSAVRDWVNPTDATSAAGMPWAYLAGPALVAGGGALGLAGADKAIGAVRDLDSKTEVDEARSRYEAALRGRVRKSAAEAEDPLDALAARRVKEGTLSAVPLGALLAGGGLLAAGGAVAGAQLGGESPKAMLERAVRERQLALLQGPKRPIEIVPEPIDGDGGDDD